jgi:flagellar protein FlaJ
MRDEILKSNMRITPEGLISLSLFAAVLSIIPVMICVALGLVLHIPYFYIAVLSPPIVFVIVWNSPKISQGGRSSALENELSMFIGFMGVLSGGGVSPIATMRRVSKMEKIFPAATKEAKRILVDIDVFGVDPITSFENAAKYSPNRTFAEFLYGYTTVLKVGGNVKSYVNNKLKETLDQRSSKVRRTSDAVGTLAEAYLTVTAVLGISLFSLFQLEGIVNQSNSGLQSLFIFSYFVIPVLSGLFIFIIDGTQPKQPYFNKLPYKVFLACIPVGVAIFLIPIPLPQSLHAALALASIVVVPTVVSFRLSRERNGLEGRFPTSSGMLLRAARSGFLPRGA